MVRGSSSPEREKRTAYFWSPEMELRTEKERHAYALGLARGAKYLMDHAQSEEDQVCQTMCVEMAQEIVALEPIVSG